MKRFWLGFIIVIFIGLMSACAGTRAIMQTAPSAPKKATALPAITAQTAGQWENQKPDIAAQLQTHIYGDMPAVEGAARVEAIHPVAQAAFNNSANISEWTITPRGDIDPFTVVMLMPADILPGETPPIILTQNFCPNHNVIPVDGISKPKRAGFSCEGNGPMSDVFGYFFGRYIMTPPVEMIMNRGYALAVVYPPDFVPDDAVAAAPILSTLSQSDNRTGAIMAWAWQASRIMDAIEESGEFGDVIAYGHSRYGKSALVAAAYDPRIDGVIAHQSGTGGASLSRSKPGETVKLVTEGYPHWFTPKYADYADDQSALPVDQHQLLALIAPRPIMLGNAKRDVWSDPEGAFRAAMGASPAYALYGSEGLTAIKLTEFKPEDDIAFWMRPGTHGVVEEDWPAFLDFLDAHFK